MTNALQCMPLHSVATRKGAIVVFQNIFLIVLLKNVFIIFLQNIRFLSSHWSPLKIVVCLLFKTLLFSVEFINCSWELKMYRYFIFVYLYKLVFFNFIVHPYILYKTVFCKCPLFVKGEIVPSTDFHCLLKNNV